MKKWILLAAMIAVFAAPPLALAQETEAEAPAPAPSVPGLIMPTPEQLAQPFTGSLLYTDLELNAINNAMAGFVPGAFSTDPNVASAIPVVKIIRLSGVAYKSSNNWIVWLNGYKMTPGNLLPEIVDIRVENDRVHLKWFYAKRNEILSITLRPHQTYDIESGILLPG